MGINLRYAPPGPLYITAGFGDANGDPDRNATEGLTSFGQGRYFEAAEVGLSADLSSVWAAAHQGTYRLTGWHTAATDHHVDGSGFALSFDQEIGAGIVPFVRFGYCPDDVFKTSVETSWGVEAAQPFDRATDRAGIAATWSKPVASADRAQVAVEVFYRLEVVEGIALSPDIELIPDPTQHPQRDFVAVLGLRTRLTL